MDPLTPELNQLSIETIRSQIDLKNSANPYFSNGSIVKSSVTDYDHHPYSRFFRGVYYYNSPIVMEREAGWRPLQNSCYKMIIPEQEGDRREPEYCFEGACSAVLPCVKSYLKKYSDRDSLDLMLNNACTIQYR